MKVLLLHPITHDGKDYSRGMHDIDDSLAKLWFKEAPHAIQSFGEFAPGVVAKAADAPELKVGANVETHNLSANAVAAMVAEDSSIEHLKALLEGEKAHPNYPNGRKGVLDAINIRITELTKSK